MLRYACALALLFPVQALAWGGTTVYLTNSVVVQSSGEVDAYNPQLSVPGFFQGNTSHNPANVTFVCDDPWAGLTLDTTSDLNSLGSLWKYKIHLVTDPGGVPDTTQCRGMYNGVVRYVLNITAQ